MRKIIILATVLLVCIAIVSALQPIPESRVGYATLNEAPATYDTPITVEVYNTGEVVGSTTVQYPDGGYSLDIIFDDPDTPEDEGANEGDQLTWKINSIDCSTPAPGTDTATPGGRNNNFNIAATSADNPPSTTVLHPGGGESIPVGTQVQVSAHATDDTAVTSVTFSYSNNSGSDWTSIGAGTRVSGTDKNGIWNRTWNTNSLGAGSNYLIKAVASDGTSHGEDQSDSTFSLTCTPPSAPTLNDPGTTDTDGSYTVSWSSVSDATNYTLEEDTSGSFGSPTVVHSGSGTSKYITGRSDGTYYYRVNACNACGCGGWSNVEDIEVSILHEEEGWNRTFGGTDGDVAYSVQQTSDGGFILAGYTDSYGAGNSDFWLVKTNSNGGEQWNMTFGGASYDIARSVQQTSDGGYILTGCTNSYGAGSSDFWLVKTDSNGYILWDTTFGGTGWDMAESVQQTSDGGFILAGYTDSYGDVFYDACLVKVDCNGCVQWNTTFGGSGRNVAESVQQTSDGGYIIAGYTQPQGSYLLSTGFMNPLGVDFADAWLVKINSNGNKQWDKTFGGTDWDKAESVHETSDGGFILAGYTKSYGDGDSDFWLIKTDSEGYKEWDKTFGETDDDYAYSVQQTSDGGYILAGVTKPHNDPPAPLAISMSPCGAGGSDVWLVKTDLEGGKEWDKTFGGIDDDYATSVQQTSDGGYVVAGCTNSYGAGGSDFWLIKLGTAAQMRGDLNSDGILTPADAVIALHLAASGGWDPAADMNSDDCITSLDALMILSVTPTAQSSREPPCDSYGDVDDDGYVTIDDYDLVRSYAEGGWDAVKGKTSLTSEEEFKRRADIDGDDEVSFDDSVFIDHYINGTYDTFPLCP
jgi:uncharacterized delta-60 repeat protein